MEIWKYGNMEIWKFGNMEIWKSRDEVIFKSFKLSQDFTTSNLVASREEWACKNFIREYGGSAKLVVYIWTQASHCI